MNLYGRNYPELNEKVTVIGLEHMGAALAEAFIQGGYSVTVWNRSPEKAEVLLEKGARLAKSIEDAVTSSQTLVVCVSTYETMRSILAGAESQLYGRILINLTTGTPEEARITSVWAKDRGIHYPAWRSRP